MEKAHGGLAVRQNIALLLWYGNTLEKHSVSTLCCLLITTIRQFLGDSHSRKLQKLRVSQPPGFSYSHEHHSSMCIKLANPVQRNERLLLTNGRGDARLELRRLPFDE